MFDLLGLLLEKVIDVVGDLVDSAVDTVADVADVADVGDGGAVGEVADVPVTDVGPAATGGFVAATDGGISPDRFDPKPPLGPFAP